MRSATAFWSLVSHSQITMTLHPSSRRRASLRSSRATVAWNLLSQYSSRVLGLEAYLQLGCRCQKHPCTNMTERYRGNTRSGQPGRSRRCMRNRYPSLWEIRRTTNSGLVSRLLTRDMISLRFSLSTVSAIFESTSARLEVTSIALSGPNADRGNRGQPHALLVRPGSTQPET